MHHATPTRNRFHLAWPGLNEIRFRDTFSQPGTPRAPSRTDFDFAEGTDMAKYLIAWILGVPAIVLVLIYLLF